MTKLKFNEHELKKVKEALKNTVGYVQSAKYNSDFSVPSDFIYASYLNNLKDQIGIHYKDLNSLVSWIERATNDVNETFGSINNEARNLEIIKLREKSQSVTIQ